MLAHADMDDTGPRDARGAAERTCIVTRAVKPVDELIRFVTAPDGAVVADLKRRLPGRGVWVTATRSAVDEAVKRKAFGRGLKRGTRRSRSRPRGRVAAGARRARCAGDCPQGRPGQNRFRENRGRACRRSGRGGPSGVRRVRGRRAQDRRGGGQAPNGGNRGRNPDNRGFHDRAIGFGIGAVKCGTCCPACRPSEQRVPRALPKPRTLPDGCSGRTRPGKARGLSIEIRATREAQATRSTAERTRERIGTVK